MPDIEQMVTTYLTEHGYHGLSGDGCACEIGDLMPCTDPDPNGCRAGYRTECAGDCEDAPCDFHMVPDRRAVVRADELTEAELAAGRARRKELLK